MNKKELPLIIANWKMYGTLESANDLTKELTLGFEKYKQFPNLVVCPPYTLINKVKDLLAKYQVKVGAQDCSLVNYDQGAYTGEISNYMLKDIGCQYVIVGHSERRTLFKENSKIVKQKANNAYKNNMIPIICVGETIEEREKNIAFDVIAKQLQESIPSHVDNVIIAYEPVWAIGTGKTASTDQIEEMHDFIKTNVKKFLPNLSTKIENSLKILYGGSVKENNAKDIFSINNVNGALVGSASLHAKEFLAILSASLTK